MAIELPERKKGNVFILHTTSFVNKKKRAKIMGKNKACEKTTSSKKNHLATRNQSSKVIISES